MTRSLRYTWFVSVFTLAVACGDATSERQPTAVNSGGTASGGMAGAPMVGSVTPGVGGAAVTGGAAATGGAAVTGGATATGGAAAMGGAAATGGAAAMGGAAATGGAAAMGGAAATGGAAAMGGAAATGGAAAKGGAAGMPVNPPPKPPPALGDLLPQAGNPIQGELDFADQFLAGDPAKDREVADKMVAWQIANNGGWMKTTLTTRYLNDGMPTPAELEAEHSRNRNLGCLDNEATTLEMTVLAQVYKQTSDAKYQESARTGLDFLIKMQNKSGGFAQYFPDRAPNHYSNHATLNDGSMVRAVTLLQRAARQEAPFDTDIFTPEQLTQANAAVELAVDFFLKAQIIDGGARTVWCAQHGMDDYAPKLGRSYELPSKSGSESVGVLGLLMSRPQTPEIVEAVKGALAWFRDPSVYLKDHKYVRPSSNADPTPLRPSPGDNIWFRFYDLKGNSPIFANREGVIFRDVLDLRTTENRYFGYSWGGSWPAAILKYADSLGY